MRVADECSKIPSCAGTCKEALESFHHAPADRMKMQTSCKAFRERFQSQPEELLEGTMQQQEERVEKFFWNYLASYARRAKVDFPPYTAHIPHAILPD